MNSMIFLGSTDNCLIFFSRTLISYFTFPTILFFSLAAKRCETKRATNFANKTVSQKRQCHQLIFFIIGPSNAIRVTKQNILPSNKWGRGLRRRNRKLFTELQRHNSAQQTQLPYTTLGFTIEN